MCRRVEQEKESAQELQFQHAGVAEMFDASPCLPSAKGDRLEAVTSEKQGYEWHCRADDLDDGIARGERCGRGNHQRNAGLGGHRECDLAFQIDAFGIARLVCGEWYFGIPPSAV